MFKTLKLNKYSLLLLFMIVGNAISSDKIVFPLPNSKGNIGVTIVPALTTDIYRKWLNEPPVKGDQVLRINSVKTRPNRLCRIFNIGDDA